MASLWDPITKNAAYVGQAETVEYIGPERMRVALECAYCGKVIVVDLMLWNGECYRCTGSASIDEIATALALIPPPPQLQSQAQMDQLVYGSGTVGLRSTDPIMMSMIGGSGSYPDQRLYAPAVSPPPKVNYFMGKAVLTKDDRERAEEITGIPWERMVLEHEAELRNWR